MLAADAILPFGANWYDVLVLVALVYGLWSGVRTGLSGELVGVVGLVLMVVVAVNAYLPVGHWLKDKTTWPEETANLLAFVGLAVAMYLVTMIARLIVHRRMKTRGFSAAIENVGGALAGAVRMTMLMAWLTVMLCLARSPFWHDQVGQKSRFGAYIVQRTPAVAAVVEKHFPERFLPFRKLQRRPETGLDDGEPEKQ